MTLPPSRSGDKGQRYMVEAEGYPKPGWQPIGYSDTEAGARAMKTGILLAPSCTDARIVDRQLPLPLEGS